MFVRSSCSPRRRLAVDGDDDPDFEPGGAFTAKALPADEIWVNDSDVIVIPKIPPILVTDNFINLVFTRGIYGVVPFNLSYTWSNFASLSGI